MGLSKIRFSTSLCIHKLAKLLQNPEFTPHIQVYGQKPLTT